MSWGILENEKNISKMSLLDLHREAIHLIESITCRGRWPCHVLNTSYMLLSPPKITISCPGFFVDTIIGSS
jgi:hypothetical protein